MRLRRFGLLGIGVFFSMALGFVGAQNPWPDRSSHDVKHNGISHKKTKKTQGTATSDAQSKIFVRRFIIQGATVFKESTLQNLLTSLTNKHLTFPELQAAADRITRYYHIHGYLVARAYLPQQTVTNQEVTIVVLEAQLGALHLNNHSLLSDAVVRRYFSPNGTILYGPALERQMLLLTDTAGVSLKPNAPYIDATLQPGASVGLSDLVVDLQPLHKVSGNIYADTYGDKFTGIPRLGGRLNWNSPFHVGDQFAIQAQNSFDGRRLQNCFATSTFGNCLNGTGDFKHVWDGLTYWLVSYKIPVPGTGLGFGASYQQSHYQLARQFLLIGAHGNAKIASAYTSYAFVRSNRWNLLGITAYDNKQLKDIIAAFSSVNKRAINLGRTGLTMSYYPTEYSGVQFSLSYFLGNLKFENPAFALIDAGTVHTQGFYQKWTALGSVYWRLGRGWLLLLSGQGQLSSKNLDPSEKFVLGGPYAVRAYPQDAAQGDEGYVTSVELRYLWSRQILGTIPYISVFFDTGQVRFLHTPISPASPVPVIGPFVPRNTLTLTGAGIGIGVESGVRNLKASLQLAWKINAKNVPRDNRDPIVWFQLVKDF